MPARRGFAVRPALLVALAACGNSRQGCQPPLERLGPTAPAALAPGNETGQDEDPSILVTRKPDALYAARYSNRLGVHTDGLARKEILVTRSTASVFTPDVPGPCRPELVVDDGRNAGVAADRASPPHRSSVVFTS